MSPHQHLTATSRAAVDIGMCAEDAVAWVEELYAELPTDLIPEPRLPSHPEVGECGVVYVLTGQRVICDEC